MTIAASLLDGERATKDRFPALDGFALGRLPTGAVQLLPGFEGLRDDLAPLIGSDAHRYIVSNVDRIENDDRIIRKARLWTIFDERNGRLQLGLCNEKEEAHQTLLDARHRT